MRKQAESAANKIRALGPPTQLVHQVHMLPEAMAQALREMIVQGASPEFAADEVNKRHDWDGPPKAESRSTHPVTHPEITLPAVQQYCRADRDLQRERAHYLVQSAEAITSSLSESGNLEEGDSRYVHAVVMTGLTKINQADSSLSTKEAIKARDEGLNLKLRNRLLRLRDMEAARRVSYTEAQRKLTDAKRNFVQAQTRELRKMVGKLAKSKNLTPDTLRKIQETYGILAQNVAETALGPSLEELQGLPAGPPPQPDEASEPQQYYFHSPERVAQELLDPMDKFKKDREEACESKEQKDSGADLQVGPEYKE